MKQKLLLTMIACAAGLGVANTAAACSFGAWGAGLPANQGTIATGGVATNQSGNMTTATLVAGDPDDFSVANGIAVPRYSQSCGALAKAQGNYVQDGSPAAEASYRARFYVYTGLTSGPAVVFRALDASNAEKISITYNQAAGNLEFRANGGTPTTAAVVANRWYGIEINWNRGSTSMTATVRGNRSPLDANVITNAPVAGVLGTDAIDTVQLGWISGGGAGRIVFDAFESRRSTQIGLLVRGDASGDGQFTGADLSAFRREIVGTAFAPGQVDCTEDGEVSSLDLTCIRRRTVGTE